MYKGWWISVNLTENIRLFLNSTPIQGQLFKTFKSRLEMRLIYSSKKTTSIQKVLFHNKLSQPEYSCLITSTFHVSLLFNPGPWSSPMLLAAIVRTRVSPRQPMQTDRWSSPFRLCLFIPTFTGRDFYNLARAREPTRRAVFRRTRVRAVLPVTTFPEAKS